MFRNLVFSFFMFFISFTVLSQVGIGTTNPERSSILELKSSNQGFLPPRVALVNSTDVTTITSPAEGLMVYNTGTPCGLPAGVYVFAGGKWNKLAYGGGQPNSRIVKDVIGFSNVSVTTINSNNFNGPFSSLFDGADNVNSASFHLSKTGSPAGDWGFAINLGSAYFISELVLDGRDDCCSSRVGNILARFYLCGVEVFSSAPITGGFFDKNLISVPNIYADEVRLVIPLGGNTENGDSTMNFSELHILGAK